MQKSLSQLKTTPSARPISPYAATKAAGELLVTPMQHLIGVAAMHLPRFFTVYERANAPISPYTSFRKAISKAAISHLRRRQTRRDDTYMDDSSRVGGGGCARPSITKRAITSNHLGESNATRGNCGS